MEFRPGNNHVKPTARSDKKSGHPTKYLLGRKLDPIEKWGNILRWK